MTKIQYRLSPNFPPKKGANVNSSEENILSNLRDSLNCKLT